MASKRNLRCVHYPSSVASSAALVDNEGNVIVFAVHSDGAYFFNHNPETYLCQVLKKWPQVEIIITLSATKYELHFMCHKVKLPREPLTTTSEPSSADRDKRGLNLDHVPLEYIITSVVNAQNCNQDILIGKGEETFVVEAEQVQSAWKEIKDRPHRVLSDLTVLNAIWQMVEENPRFRESR